MVAPRRELKIWRRMRVWATAHAVATSTRASCRPAVPYFVLERN